MKGEQFKGEWEGLPRTQFEPLNPKAQLSSSGYGYVRRPRGKKYVWLCHCPPRHDWLIRTLVQHGVNVRHFMARSKEVPPRKCLEIAAVLRKVKKSGEGDREYPPLIDEEIRFWANCGGVKIHDWVSAHDLV